jgi:hypothetical protein
MFKSYSDSAGKFPDFNFKTQLFLDFAEYGFHNIFSVADSSRGNPVDVFRIFGTGNHNNLTIWPYNTKNHLSSSIPMDHIFDPVVIAGIGISDSYVLYISFRF